MSSRFWKMAGIVMAGGVALCGCSQAQNEETKVLGIVPKYETGVFSEILNGISTEADLLGYEVIVEIPEDATVSSQLDAIQELIDAGADCIAISANAESGFSDTLEECLSLGIEVISFDSHIYSEDIWLEVLACRTEEIGVAFLEQASQISSGSGQFAILTTTNQDYNCEAEIKGLRQELEEGAYPDLHLTEVAYVYNDESRCIEKIEHLLETYPQLEFIFCMDGEITRIAAAYLAETDYDIQVLGLGIPDEIAAIEGGTDICPVVLYYDYEAFGELVAAAAIAADTADGEAQEGESLILAGNSYEIVQRQNLFDGAEAALNVLCVLFQDEPDLFISYGEGQRS